MLRKTLTSLLAIGATVMAHALPADSISWSNDRMILNHLDASVTLGTAGLGLEIAAPITRFVKVRAGVEWMPRFNVPVTFGLESYRDGQAGAGNFSNQQQMMKELTGIEVDDRVEMDCKPNLTNFKFLIDVYPWEGSGWHFTTGFYLGPRKIATAVNSINEMHSLFAVNLYNSMYERVMDPNFFDTPLWGDIKLSPDAALQLQDKMAAAGEIGIHVGNFKGSGAPYMMVPDKEGMVKANAYANFFRPYFGFGYGGPITDNKRLSLSFDAGMFVWGKPRVITHDGLNLVDDVTDIGGKVGDYVDFMRSFRVYPVLEVKLTYSFF